MKDDGFYEEGFGDTETFAPLYIRLYMRLGMLAEAYEVALKQVGGRRTDAHRLLKRVTDALDPAAVPRKG